MIYEIRKIIGEDRWIIVYDEREIASYGTEHLAIEHAAVLTAKAFLQAKKELSQ